MSNGNSVKLKSHLKKWGCLEIFIPVFIVLAVYWPLGSYMAKIPHLFNKIFASAELLPISAIILLKIYTEVQELNLSDDKDKDIDGILDTLHYLALGFAFIVIFCYGYVKFEYLKYTFPLDDSIPVDDVIKSIGRFSIIVAFASVGVASFCKIRCFKLKTK